MTRRGLPGLLGAGALFLGLACASSSASPRRATEHDVKAALVVNLTRFVDWPASGFDDPGSPLRIGVLGNGPMRRALDLAAAGQTSHGRPLEVRRASSTEELRGAQVAVFADVDPERSGEALAELGPSGVLTIIDGESVAGCPLVRLVLEGQHAAFRIDRNAVERSGLRLSSQLLRLSSEDAPCHEEKAPQ